MQPQYILPRCKVALRICKPQTTGVIRLLNYVSNLYSFPVKNLSLRLCKNVSRFYIFELWFSRTLAHVTIKSLSRSWAQGRNKLRGLKLHTISCACLQNVFSVFFSMPMFYVFQLHRRVFQRPKKKKKVYLLFRVPVYY